MIEVLNIPINTLFNTDLHTNTMQKYDNYLKQKNLNIGRIILVFTFALSGYFAYGQPCFNRL